MTAILMVVILLAPSDKYLMDLGTEMQVQSIATGTLAGDVQKVAEEHAEWQATWRQCSHEGHQRRFRTLRAKYPECRGWAEVVAMTSESDMKTAAKNILASWRGSPPHWASVNGPCKLYGYSMRKSKTGAWYACGIFGAN